MSAASWGGIDIGMLIDYRIKHCLEIFKSKALLIIELALAIGVNRVVIIFSRHYVGNKSG